MPRLKPSRLKRVLPLLVIPFVCMCVMSIRRAVHSINKQAVESRYDTMRRFLSADKFVVYLRNRIAARKIQTVIEQEMENNRFWGNFAANDIGRSIKQTDTIGRKYRLPHCIHHKPSVTGRIDVNFTLVENMTMAEVEEENHDVNTGGSWRPDNCVSSHRVAIVIPFRDRGQHLTILLHYLIPVLKRQQLDFQFFVVEQNGTFAFNKGVLMNAGFLEALQFRQFECVIFHDVDLIPLDDRNLYSCPRAPQHLSVGVDVLEYEYPYDKLAGGVLNMPIEYFLAVNGYSNKFWGWGGEDDEMGQRIEDIGVRLQRPPSNVAKYAMIVHKKRKSDYYTYVHKLLDNTSGRMLEDGLNSIKYNLLHLQRLKLYTHLLVDVGIPPWNQTRKKT